jgi:hypothetical protein
MRRVAGLAGENGLQMDESRVRQSDLWSEHLKAIEDEDKFSDGVEADLLKLKDVLAMPLAIVRLCFRR